MSTAVLLYCHECKATVNVGAEEFTCSRCNGGFVELMDNASRGANGAALGGSSREPIDVASDDDADGFLTSPSPLHPTHVDWQSFFLGPQLRSQSSQRYGRSDSRDAQRDSNSATDESASAAAPAGPYSSASNAQPETSLGSGGSQRYAPASNSSGGPRPLAGTVLRGVRRVTSRDRAFPPRWSYDASSQPSAAGTNQQSSDQAGLNADFNARHSSSRRGLPQNLFGPSAARRYGTTMPSGGAFMDVHPPPADIEGFISALMGYGAPIDQQPGAAGAQATYAHPFLGFPFAQLFAPMHGDPGDYVFSEQGVDNVITQLLSQLGSTGGPPPARADIIEGLPDAHITAEQTQSGLQCFVCFEEFSKDEKVKRLPCGHHYHADCILPWLQLHGTCPVCRKTLDGVDTSTYSHDRLMQPPSEGQSPGAADASAAGSSNGNAESTARRNTNHGEDAQAGDQDGEQFYDAPDHTEPSSSRPRDYFS